jgi:hypothetical protein
LVVYPPSDHAVMYWAEVSTLPSSVSTETPFQVVSSLDHLVTQWMSTVSVSEGSARNSSHGHDTAFCTWPWIVNVHSSSGVCGVGPADSTGKSDVTYCPGGTRDGSATGRRRPKKPRDTGDISSPPCGR